jgi:methyl-accepting chemotaxis protein
MKKDKTIQTNQLINDQLNDLLGEAKNILKEIDETNNQIKVALDDISVKVDESIAKVEKIYSDLDQIEKEAGDEIDKLILQQAEDLAEE